MTQLPLIENTRNRLDAGKMFKLTGFVQAEYVASKLTDKDFAEKAAGFLGFGVSDSSVSKARQILEIPSNRDVARQENKEKRTTTADLAPVEKRLDTLEAQVRKLFSLSDESRVTVKIPSDAHIIRIRDELYKTHSAESGDFRAIELVRQVLRGEF